MGFKSAELPRLYLCGLGNFPPYMTSLNVLHAMRRCDVIVAYASDAETRGIVAEFCPGVKTALCHDGDGGKSAMAQVSRALKQGGVVGFVTRGHPLLYGGPAGRLVRGCAKAKIACETFGAVSSSDVALARAKKTLGIDIDGVQAYDCRVVQKSKSLDSSQPVTVVFDSGILKGRQVGRLGRVLRRFYHSAHECLMFGPTHDAAAKAFRLEGMERLFPEIHPKMILYLEPSGKPLEDHKERNPSKR